MNIDSNKYTSLLSSLEVELITRLQDYAEFYGIGYLSVFGGRLEDAKCLVSQCIYKLKKEDIVFPPNFLAESVIESGARKAYWFYRECDFALEKRIRAHEEEERLLHELSKTYKIYKQIQDLE